MIAALRCCVNLKLAAWLVDASLALLPAALIVSKISFESESDPNATLIMSRVMTKTLSDSAIPTAGDGFPFTSGSRTSPPLVTVSAFLRLVNSTALELSLVFTKISNWTVSLLV